MTLAHVAHLLSNDGHFSRSAAARPAWSSRGFASPLLRHRLGGIAFPLHEIKVPTLSFEPPQPVHVDSSFYLRVTHAESTSDHDG